MAKWYKLVLLTTWAYGLVSAQGMVDPYNVFLAPPASGIDDEFQDDPVYAIGTQVRLQFRTTYPKITAIWYQNRNSSYQILDHMDNVVPTSGHLWNVSIDGIFDLKNGNVFFIQVYNATSLRDPSISSPILFSSHYFNITDPTKTTSAASASSTSTTSQTSGGASSTGTPGSSTSPSSTPGATSNSTGQSDNSSQSNSSHGLSTGAKIGVGVGAGVGAAAIAVAGILTLLRRRRNSKRSGVEEIPPSHHNYPPAMSHTGSFSTLDRRVPVHAHYDPGAPALPSNGPAEMYTEARTHELPSQNVVQELDGGLGHGSRGEKA